MRVTVGMISRQYSSQLNKSLERMNYYNNRATSFRKFDKVSENPVSAAQAFRLRREYQSTDDYQTNLRDADNMFMTAESSMMAINKMVQEAGSGDCIQAITGTTGEDGREIIAKKLREIQNSILSTANVKFADQYIFGGTDRTQPAFTIGDNGKLLYRGADVDTGMYEKGAQAAFNGSTVLFGKDNGALLNGYTFKVQDGPAGTPVVDNTAKTITVSLNLTGGATNADLQNALQSIGAGTVPGVDFTKVTVEGNAADKVLAGSSTPISDTANLAALADEKVYTDLGLGLGFDANRNINEQSAFNISLPGISYLGFGTTGNGVSNNLYNLLGQIADQLTAPDFSIEKIQPYLDNFETQQTNLLTNITGMGTKSKFLDYTKTRLNDNQYNLEVKMNDVEMVDPALAIMDFKMQEFAYRAALQMGTKVLQPTFLDFMS